MDEVEPEPKPGKYPSLDDILRDEPEPQFLLPCTICNKTFNPESLQRHSKICEKNSTRKRKQFDSFKQRVHGTGIAEFLSLAPIRKEKPTSPRKAINSWKEKHEAFVSAIRAARSTDTTNGKSLYSASGDGRTPLRNSDHEQCLHCGRSFGPKSFDRHIEWCREQRQRQPPSAASQQARERLEARIKYRAPPCKSKRSLMREKYSPLAQRKNRDQSPSSVMSMSVTNASLTNVSSTHMTKSMSAGSHKSQPPEPPVRYNRAFSLATNRTQIKETSSNQGLNRGGISRTSIRASQRAAQRSVSPKKPISPASTKTSKTPPYRPSSRASDRWSNESLNFLLSSTEVADRKPSNSSLSTKRKQSNENNLLQSPPQIIPKIEADRSRRSSTQRPYHPLPPESPIPNPTQAQSLNLIESFTEGISMRSEVQCETAVISQINCVRDSSSDRPSGLEESSAPYLLSNSSSEDSSDDDVPEPKRPISVFTCPSSFNAGVRPKMKKKESECEIKPRIPLVEIPCAGRPIRKRRRVSTPVTPRCIDIYQSRHQNSMKANFLNDLDKALTVGSGDEDIIDLDNLSSQSDDFDFDPSSDDDFREKRASCSASTYTKDRSSFVDGVLRVPSSERDRDFSEFSPDEAPTKIESPKTASQSSARTSIRTATRTAMSIKRILPSAKFDDCGAKKSKSPICESVKAPTKNAEKVINTAARKILLSSPTHSPARSPRCRSDLKLPALSSPKRVTPERKVEPFSALRTTLLKKCVIPAPSPAPVVRIKNKVILKLEPLKKAVPVDVSLSAVSERPDAYDPYQSAERQMFELFNSDSAADLSVAAENRKNQEKVAPSSSPSISPSHSPSPCPPLETSPTSAFTRYSKETDLEPRTPSPAPAPPPRQHRSVSVELPSIKGPPRPHLKTHHSVDGHVEPPLEAPKSPKPFLTKRNSDDRPRTYDIYRKEDREPSPVFSLKDDSTPDILVVIDTPSTPPISPPPEFVELREKPIPKTKESRESREVREITDKDPSEVESSRDLSPLSPKFLDLSDEISIDNLMEEVARMQQYVTLMSNTSPSRPKHQSAKSRRSRASKMLIEDYLYPADSPMRGTTPVMGDVLNPGLDLNANTDNEDNDVVVSPNALAEALKTEIGPRGDGLTSPVRPKDLGSLSPDSSRNPRISVEAATTDIRRRLPGDSDEDEVRSSPNSPVPRTTSNRQSTGSRLSGDSAYSSLNRKSPIPSSKGTAPVRPTRQIRNTSPTSLLSQSLQAQSLTQSRDLSSSSSESSLHAMSTSLTSRKSLSLDPSKLSKFCHECGTKFPVSNAKFCPECGIRRLGM